jgi:tetratricopeptide (TPR) repeat protein
MTNATWREDELWSLAHLGWTYLERGRLDEAQKIFAGLTVLAPKMGYPWQALGLIARRRGDLGRAIGCFKHAQQLEPTNTEVRLGLGEVLLLAGEHAEARGALAYVIAHGEDSSAIARARALMSR